MSCILIGHRHTSAQLSEMQESVLSLMERDVIQTLSSFVMNQNERSAVLHECAHVL
jgi:hypothetical protein